MPASFVGGENAMATQKDPVCAMDVDMAKAPGGKSVHHDKTYYFCSPVCRRGFEQDPAKYASDVRVLR